MDKRLSDSKSGLQQAKAGLPASVLQPLSLRFCRSFISQPAVHSAFPDVERFRRVHCLTIAAATTGFSSAQ
jgi:hypothetical protein